MSFRISQPHSILGAPLHAARLRWLLEEPSKAHVPMKADRTVSQSLTNNCEVMHLLKVMRVDLHLASSEFQRYFGYLTRPVLPPFRDCPSHPLERSGCVLARSDCSLLSMVDIFRFSFSGLSRQSARKKVTHKKGGPGQRTSKTQVVDHVRNPFWSSL